MNIENLLDEREKTHGNYVDVARAAQNIKNVMRSAPNWPSLNVRQQESLDMIANKIARILCGDSHHVDHWRDVAGYAVLIIEALEKEA